MKLFSYLFIVMFLQGCSGQEPMQDDFIGVWKSSDGSTIELKEENQFEAINFNLSNIIKTENLSKESNLLGKWELATDNYGEQVVKIKAENYRFKFNISGQGLLKKKPPWKLYIFIGDPDEMNKYEFVKK